MSDQKYLIKKGRTWYVSIRVNDSAYPYVGKRHIKRNLKTHDLNEARGLRWDHVTDIKKWLTKVDQLIKSEPAKGTPEEIIHLAKTVRNEAGLMTDEEAGECLGNAQFGLDMQAEEYFQPPGKAAIGVHVDSETGYRISPDPKMTNAFTVARQLVTPGAPPQLTSQALEIHLDEIGQHVRKQTVNGRRKIVTDFINWMGGDKALKVVSRADAGRFLTENLLRRGRAIKTVKDYIGDLTAFFRWCELRGLIDSNPFKGASQTIRSTSRGTREEAQSKRRAFTMDELRLYLETIKDGVGTDDHIWNAIIICAYTGMRPEEVCSIELGDIHHGEVDYIHIPEGKTKSSVRDVPIHDILKPWVKRFENYSKDGFLLSGLKGGGYDDKKWQMLGKRARYQLRTKASITDVRVVPYSLRKNFATSLENAGIRLSTAQQLEGHEKQSLTYRLYSQGVDLEGLYDAVEKVMYSDEITQLVTMKG